MNRSLAQDLLKEKTAQKLKGRSEAQTLNNKIAVSIRTVTMTVLYTADGTGTGTLVGGQWSLVTVSKDRPPQTSGGPVSGGGVLSLNANNSLAPGALSITLMAGDPDWPISGSLSGTIDKSRPPRLSGAFTLTYPVIE